MSGIYISGMEMPKQCVSCKLWTMQIIGGKGYDICRAVDKVMKQPYGRQDFCPLISVPDHGRLIDADALVRELNSIRVTFGSTNGLVEGGLNIAVSTANRIPTIIPAEEGET